MAKKVIGEIKLHIAAAKANPSPPVGPALGQQGVNIMEFCKAFNEKTKDMAGFRVPVVITVYADRSFTFITKQPPATDLIKKAQVLEIVEKKIADLNTKDKEQAAKIIAGSARSMGISVVD